MAASTGDKVTDTRNAARPNSARVSSGRSGGGTTLACDNLAGWPTASKVHFVTYTIDSNSNPVSGTQLDCTGIVSGNNIGSLTVIDGTDTGNAVNDVVEMLPTAAWGQDLADALTSQHSRTGAHGVVTATSISTTSNATVGGTLAVTGAATLSGGTTLPAGDIATADLAAAGVTDAKLVYGKVRSRQGGSATDWTSAGTTTYDYSATNTFIQVGTKTLSAQTTTITFPTAFTNKPIVIASPNGSGGVFSSGWYVVSVTTTTFDFVAQDYTKATPLMWMAIGE